MKWIEKENGEIWIFEHKDDKDPKYIIKNRQAEEINGWILNDDGTAEIMQ